jgi:hypothetical protein
LKTFVSTLARRLIMGLKKAIGLKTAMAVFSRVYAALYL